MRRISHRSKKLLQKVHDNSFQEKTTLKHGKKDSNIMLASMLVQPKENKPEKCSEQNVEFLTVESTHGSSTTASYPIPPKLLSAKNVDLKKNAEREMGSPVSEKTISPPPYSPLTPLLLRKETLTIDDDVRSEPPSSPVPPMTPETHKLLNIILNEPLNIMSEIEDTDEDEVCEDRDRYENKNSEDEFNSKLFSDYDDNFICDENIQPHSPSFRARCEIQSKSIKRCYSETDLTNLPLKSLSLCNQSSKSLCRSLSTNVTKMPATPLKRNFTENDSSNLPSNSLNRTPSIISDKILPSSQAELQNMFPQKPIKRRVSETNLTKTPSKRVCRSSSASSRLYSLQKPASNQNKDGDRYENKNSEDEFNSNPFSDCDDNFICDENIQPHSPSFRARCEIQPKRIKRCYSETDLTNLPLKSLSLCNQSSKSLCRSLSTNLTKMPATPLKRNFTENDSSNLPSNSLNRTPSIISDSILPSSLSFQAELQNMFPQKPIKRRVSETNLTTTPSKRVCRSSSASSRLYSLHKLVSNQNKDGDRYENKNSEDEFNSNPFSDCDDNFICDKNILPHSSSFRAQCEIEPKRIKRCYSETDLTTPSLKSLSPSNQSSKIVCRSLSLSNINWKPIISKITSCNADHDDSTDNHNFKPDIEHNYTLDVYFEDNDDDSVKDPNYDPDENETDFDDHEHETQNQLKKMPATPLKRKFTENDSSNLPSNSLSRTPSIISNSILPSSLSFRAELQNMFPQKPIKRRVSETNLTTTPSKRVCRSSSASSRLYSLHKPVSNQNKRSQEPKKKRVRDPSKWKRTIQKDKRIKGEAYKTVKGKFMQARPIIQPTCVTLATHKCNEAISETQRAKIYRAFRSLKTLEKQREFIARHVSKSVKKRTTTSGPSRKAYTNTYKLPINAGDGYSETVKVCRVFFLKTLNITEGMVRGALNKLSSEGIVECDNRGKKTPANKLTPERHDFIVSHILSFPSMESHYCRKNSDYKYLDAELNLSIMYKEYTKLCEDKGEIAVAIQTYRRIFNTYKLKFHKPKKDLCKKCITHTEILKNDQNVESESSQCNDEFRLHLKRKDDAFKQRDNDKDTAINDKNILAFNFDLESVLSTPKGRAGPFFYTRKLAVYNLTFYNLGNQDGDCYTWDETEGRRGSNEIATAVYTYINSRQPGITHVKMMSDNCGGQQKNFNFCCMLLYLITNHPTIELIDHAFFETGHSHMECDSIHSKIEKKSKYTPIYTPDGWTHIMRLARTNPTPYNVTSLLHDDFKEFNPNQVQFVEDIVKKPNLKTKNKTKSKKQKQQTEKGNKPETTNKRKTRTQNKETQDDEQLLSINEDKEKVKFSDAVWIQYRKLNPDAIFIKMDYEDKCFIELKLKTKKRGAASNIFPTSIYNERIPISKPKQRDLLKLCQELQIPRAYHNYYESLPTSDTVKDRLPEPDADDNEP